MTTAPSASSVLEIDDIHVYYGAIHALKGVSLTVGEGEIVTLIGANGAGKSSNTSRDQRLNRPGRGRSASGPGHHGRHVALDREARSRAEPRGPQAVSADERHGEPGDGRIPAYDQRSSRRHGPRLRALSPPQRTPSQKAGTISGGEQQMVRDGTRTHGAAEAPPSRRAVDGTSADLRRPNLRDRSSRSTARARPSSSSSRTRSWRSTSRIVDTSWRPVGSRSRGPRASSRRTSRFARRTSERARATQGSPLRSCRRGEACPFALTCA